MSNPLVSVIIPVYKVEGYIVKCISSVVRQTIIDDIEIILVDDCGNDQSISFAKQYALTLNCHNRELIFLSHNKNRGQAAARNTGVKIARGKYLFFLDSDDSLPPTSLETLLKYASIHNCEIIEGQSIHIVSKQSKPATSPKQTVEIVRDAHLWEIGSKWMPVCWNKLIKRDFFIHNNLFFAEGFYYEDLYWAFIVAFAQPRILTVPDFTYEYLVREGSTTNSMGDRHVDSFIQLTSELYSLCVTKCRNHVYQSLICANYERIRSIAIDYVYSQCTGQLRLKLFNALRNNNIHTIFAFLSNRHLSIRHKSKLLPLYLGRFGHNLILLKTKTTKSLKWITRISH